MRRGLASGFRRLPNESGWLLQDEWAEAGAAIAEAISLGQVSPIVAKSYALSDVGQAHKDIVNPASGALGKLVIDFRL